MNEKSQITSIQLALLASCSALMFPYTFMPVLKAPPSNQDVWIVALLSFVYIVIINLPMLFLAKKFRGLDIVDTNIMILGKIGGRITASIFMIFSLFCFIACLLLMAMFMETYILSQTPTWAILIIMVLPVAYGIYKGIGTIARVATIIVPPILLTIVLFFLLGLSEMDVREMLPILADSTFFEINKGAFITASRFSEVLIIFALSYNLMERYTIKKSYILTLIIFLFGAMIMIFGTLFLVGMDIAKLAHSPFFFFSGQVGGEEIVQRVQALNVISWLFGTLIKLAVYGYISTYMFSKIIGKKSHKTCVIPFALFSFIIAVIPFFNKMSTLNVLRNDEVFPIIVFGIVFIISMVLLLAYLFRYKQVNKKVEEHKAQSMRKEKETIII